VLSAHGAPPTNCRRGVGRQTATPKGARFALIGAASAADMLPTYAIARQSRSGRNPNWRKAGTEPCKTCTKPPFYEPKSAQSWSCEGQKPCLVSCLRLTAQFISAHIGSYSAVFGRAARCRQSRKIAALTPLPINGHHSKSGPVHAGCGFDSHLRHHHSLCNKPLSLVAKRRG